MGGKRQNRKQGNKEYRVNQKLTNEQIDLASTNFLAINSSDELCDLLGISIDMLLSVYFATYSHFNIKKKDKQREIQKPGFLLCEVQKKLSYYLNCVYVKEINKRQINNSFAYIPSLQGDELIDSVKNIVSNARNHVNKKLVANLDLENFFNSINKSKLEELLKKDPFYFNEELISFILMITVYNNCLPVGAPTSPILSNFVMLELDEKFRDIPNITYSRFSDDLTFSSDFYSLPDFEVVLQNLVNSIIEAGFSINSSKKSIKKSTEKQIVTGVLVNKKTNIERKYIRSIRAILHSIGNIGFEQAAIKYAEKYKDKLLKAVRNYYQTQKIFLSDEVILNNLVYHKEWFLMKSFRARIEHVGYVKGKDDNIYKKLLLKYLDLLDHYKINLRLTPEIAKSEDIVFVTNATANSIVFYAYTFLKNSGLNDPEINELRKKFNFKDSNFISYDEILRSFQNQSLYFISLYSYMTDYDRFENFLCELENADKFKTVFKKSKNSISLKKQYYRKIFHTNNQCENLKSDYFENDYYFKNTGVFFDKNENLKDKYYIIQRSFLEILNMRKCTKC